MDTAQAIKRKKAATVTVPILLEPDLVSRRADLVSALAAARRRDARKEGNVSLAEANESDEIQAQIDALDGEIKESTIEYVFVAIPQEDWRELVNENPPTADEVKEAKRDKVPPPAFSMHHLGPKLLVAACTSPGIKKKQAETIWREWSDGEVAALFQGALSIQRTVRSVPFTLRESELIESSRRNSTTAGQEESPTASSSAGA